MLHTLSIIVVLIMTLAGILLVPLGLPGTWLIVLAGVLHSVFFPFDHGEASPLAVNAILVGLAVFGEIIEFVVGTFGSKPLQVSNGAILTAFVGGIIGAIIGVPIFLLGSLLGLFIGAFLGAFFYEWFLLKSFGRAFVNACAVLATRLVASFLKTTLALGMGIYLAIKLF